MEAAPRIDLKSLFAARAALFASLGLLGCASPIDEPAPAPAPPPAATAPVEQPVSLDPVPIAPMPVAPVASEPLPPLRAPEPDPPPQPELACSQSAMQGGAILCRTTPYASVSLNERAVAKADADGVAVIGLSRTEGPQAKISVTVPQSGEQPPLTTSLAVPVAARSDSVSRLSMTCDKIQAQTPAQKRHAEVSWVKKDKALRIFASPQAPVGLIRPAEGPYSSPFGATRTYVPKDGGCEGSTSVHNGQDIAIATGTPILAPMAGTVLLADPDLYYEGGAVFLDLGRGLVSVTMHMSRIDVAAGDVVSQGQLLGLSGATGRVTGPHLHWAIKYRNVHSEDRGTDIWLDPALLLALDAAAIKTD